MKIREIKAKSIIIKSGLPDSDFVINPYIGCMHGCIYCYAEFMKRFINHKELWGNFLDVKINAPELIPEKTNIYKNKSITIASVTDPYQPEEGRYKLMSKILAKLIPLQPKLCVMTKSCLIVRDIELLKQFKECIVGISLSLLDDKIRKEVEPFSSSVKLRIGSVKALKESTIRTSIFIAPMFPELTDWKEIIRKTKSFVDEFWFENLNVRGVNWMNIKRWLKDKRPDLLKKYEGIYFTKNNYWKNIEQEIRLFCKKDKLDFKIYFHH